MKQGKRKAKKNGTKRFRILKIRVSKELYDEFAHTVKDRPDLYGRNVTQCAQILFDDMVRASADRTNTRVYLDCNEREALAQHIADAIVAQLHKELRP